MINVSAAMSCFLQTVTVERPNIMYDTNARPVANPNTVFTIEAVVQPATAKDLQLVGEGEYSEETQRVDTKIKLFLGVDDGATSPDRIQYQDWYYKVIARGAHSPYGYYMYLIDKVDTLTDLPT